MNRDKLKAVLFIVVFLLIVAVVCSWLAGKDQNTAETNVASNVIATTTEAPVIETAPVSSAAPASAAAATVTPVPNSSGSSSSTSTTPAPTAAPTPTPAPTATPTPAPTATPEASIGTPLGSGSCSSGTGTGLDITADWSAKTISATQAEITVTVKATSYSLQLMQSVDALHISVGDQYASLGTPAISLDSNEQHTTTLGSDTFTVTINPGETVTVPLAVEWEFRGTYHNVELDTIECGGTIQLER